MFNSGIGFGDNGLSRPCWWGGVCCLSAADGGLGGDVIADVETMVYEATDG